MTSELPLKKGGKSRLRFDFVFELSEHPIQKSPSSRCLIFCIPPDMPQVQMRFTHIAEKDIKIVLIELSTAPSSFPSSSSVFCEGKQKKQNSGHSVPE